MPPAKPTDITELLAAWNHGDVAALNQLVGLVYDDIRRIARAHLRRQAAGHPVESGTLVHEAYMRLSQTCVIRCNNRAHFFALCSQMIRRILVDHARKHGSAKRGGALQVPLDEALVGSKARGVEVEALDTALTALQKIDPRKSRIVELRFFGGLSVAETAEVLEISEETVTRDWRVAKTWLFRELSRRG
jgi:RNA polymerase sigma factor (TIGR02999 family)